MEKKDSKSRGQHRLRQGRFSIPGNLYFITTCVNDKDRNIGIMEAANVIFDSLNYLNNERNVLMVCAVVMPDHVHLIFQLPEGMKISEVMHSFKRFTGKKLNGLFGSNGQFWQHQYHEHRVRKEESLEKMMNYCLENPVRAGLVDKPEDYSFFRVWRENLKKLL